MTRFPSWHVQMKLEFDRLMPTISQFYDFYHLCPLHSCMFRGTFATDLY